MFILASCQSDDTFDVEKIYKSDGLNGKTPVEIALIDTVKYHQLNTFKIPYDDYKLINDMYFMRPEEILEISAYNFGFSNVKYEDMLSPNFEGLSVRQSKKWLKEIGVDIDFVDSVAEGTGNPTYTIKVSEIIEGHYEDESMLYVMHIAENTFDHKNGWGREERTDCFMYRYKFKIIDGAYKIFTRSRIYGFTIWKNDDRSFEEELEELEQRIFLDSPNYIMTLDLNELLD